MTANKLALIAVPVALMIVIVFGMMGIEHWLATFGKTEAARLTLGRVGIALPYIAAATGASSSCSPAPDRRTPGSPARASRLAAR